MKRHLIACLLTICLATPQALAYDYCTETASGLVLCEDWDQSPAPPTADWPCSSDGCSSDCCDEWHGWEPGSSLMAPAANTGIVDNPDGPGKVYWILTTNMSGETAGGDISYSLGSLSEVWIRFRLYVGNNPGTYCQHLLFIDNFSSAELSLDFRDCIYEGSELDEIPCNGLYLVIHNYDRDSPVYIGADNPATAFDWNDHLQEWVVVEFHIDTVASTCDLWINETKYVSDMEVELADIGGAVNFPGISGWGCDGTASAGTNLYFDDFAVSTAGYIGPPGGGGEPDPDPDPGAGGEVVTATGGARMVRATGGMRIP